MRFVRSVLEGLHGGGQPAAPVDEHRGVALVDRHDGAIAQQAAKVQLFAGLAADGGDHTHRGGLGVDHADGRLVGDQAADDRGGGVPRDDDHVDAHAAHGGHGLQLFDGQAAGLGGVDHAGVLADGDEGPRQAAHMVGCHDAALFDGVVEQGQAGGGAAAAAGLQAHLLQDVGHAVPDGGGGGQRQVHDAKGHAQTAAGLLGHQLAHTGDPEGGLLDGLRHHVKGLALHGLQGVVHHAGAGHAHVDDPLGLAHAVEGAGHEGVILHSVAEHHQLGAAEAALVGGAVRAGLHGLAHELHGVHVDARLGGADVHGGAHQVGDRQGLGNGGDEVAVPPGHALLHQGGEAADEVDAGLLGRPVQSLSKGHIVVGVRSPRHQGDGSHRDALVDNGNAKLRLNVLSGLHQVLGGGGDLVVDLLTGHLGVGVAAVQQRDTHGDGADIQVLLVNHVNGG